MVQVRLEKEGEGGGDLAWLVLSAAPRVREIRLL